jgi:hypothetical protein
MSVAVAILAMATCLTDAMGQSLPGMENGRYALAPVTDGVVRLDTRTGAVTTCSDKGFGWACYTVPDERAAFDAEIGRLQQENETLRAQLAHPSVAGKTDEALPKQDSLKQDSPKQDSAKQDSPKQDLPKQDAPKPKVGDGERKIEIPKIEIPLPSDRDVDRAMSIVEQAWRRLVDMANRFQRDQGGRI